MCTEHPESSLADRSLITHREITPGPQTLLSSPGTFVKELGGPFATSLIIWTLCQRWWTVTGSQSPPLARRALVTKSPTAFRAPVRQNGREWSRSNRTAWTAVGGPSGRCDCRRAKGRSDDEWQRRRWFPESPLHRQYPSILFIVEATRQCSQRRARAPDFRSANAPGPHGDLKSSFDPVAG